MSSPARTDENLLFGILALQMDFISRDALIAAMHAWVLDKGKPLAQILCEQGALAAARRALLEALVAEHLKLHDNDPEKSLASVSSLGSLRAELQAIADPDVLASLAHLSCVQKADVDPDATRPPAAGTPSSAGLRFHRLRPHAQGGLGEVFVAHDTELHREVALKEIQDRHADNPDSRARFVREAEITGRLEHPGIVPVYGLGQYADGRPFYAMRFIPGYSLQEAIARFHKAEEGKRDPGERALELRQLLGRFVDVCDAIAYAHSRGVLHRDLKPGNVMLGHYGETLVVDWGLAKPNGRPATEDNGPVREQPLEPRISGSATPTQMGTAIGTPAYMPPEQATGRLEQLGPASDVYSLGATLYCLLTGQPPFSGQDPRDVLRRVQLGEFSRPRSLKPTVPAALEAVCLKAMALKPEDRYASARALAKDIEHWLADEPVSAWREPWRVRARRWLGRHRTLVSTAAATLVVATASLTAATVLLQAANTRERQANADKETALRQAEDNAAEARHQEKLALEQKREAEDNAREAKHQKELVEEQKRETWQQASITRAVNEFLQKDLLLGHADERPKLLGLGEVPDPDVRVRTLLDRASRSIDGKFVEQPLTEAAIRLTIGNAYKALGRYTEAEWHLERSLQLRVAHLGDDDPDTLASKGVLASLYLDQGRYDVAESVFNELRQERRAEFEMRFTAVLYWNNSRWRLNNARRDLERSRAAYAADHPVTLATESRLAMVYREQGCYNEAEPIFKAVLRTKTDKLGAGDPDTLTSKSNLALLYQDQGKYDLAEPLFKEVLQGFADEFGADHPATFTSKINLAGLYQHQGKYGLAESLYKEVLQARTAKLGVDHPATLTMKSNLASLYQDERKYGLAESLYKEVLQARTAKFGADHPATLSSKNQLAWLYQKQGKSDLAESRIKEVLQASTSKLGAYHPETLISKHNLAQLYQGQGKYGLAESLYKDVLQPRTERLGPYHPHTLTSKSGLASLYHDQGRYDLAEPLLKEVLRTRTSQRGADHPDTLFTMALLSLNLLRQKKYADAEPILWKELVIWEKNQPDSWITFATCSMLGEALAGQKKYAEAELLLLRGYEGMKQREKSIPPNDKSCLREGLERLVQLYDAWGKKDRADEYRKKLAAERARSSPEKK